MTDVLVLAPEVTPAWWPAGSEPALPFPAYPLRSLPAGRLVASVRREGRAIPAIVQDEGRYVLAFDPAALLRWLTTEYAFVHPPPIYARFPLLYRLMPDRARDVARRVLAGRRSGGYDLALTEASAADLWLAALRQMGYASPQPLWPEGKRFAVALTHDVDTARGLALAPEFASIEQAAGLRSCWYVVGQRYPLDHALLERLQAEGHEIGLHGDQHDGRLAFLPEERIRQRLRACQPLIERYAMEGFRSPMLLRTRRLLSVVREFFRYDSSVPDHSVVFPPRLDGCLTTLPFSIEGLTILPITLPRDGTLRALGCSPDDIGEIWQAKVQWIKSVGGQVNLLTHPEPLFSGNQAMLAVYERFLAWLGQDQEAWFALPREIAQAAVRTGYGTLSL